MKPYIGVEDFASPAQIVSVRNLFPRNASHELHVGIMTSYKQLNGLPSKWADVFPKPEALATLLSVEGVQNCLHYVDYDANTDSFATLGKAIPLCGTNLHSVQLDMVWPQPEDVQTFWLNHSSIEIILQLNARALADIGHDPNKLRARLGSYGRSVSRVLLDLSGGRGLVVQPDLLRPYVQALVDFLPEEAIGIAGGLGPETLHDAQPLLRDFPHMSIDAQSRLHEFGNAMLPLDHTRVHQYASMALRLFAELQRNRSSDPR